MAIWCKRSVSARPGSAAATRPVPPQRAAAPQAQLRFDVRWSGEDRPELWIFLDQVGAQLRELRRRRAARAGRVAGVEQHPLAPGDQRLEVLGLGGLGERPQLVLAAGHLGGVAGDHVDQLLGLWLGLLVEELAAGDLELGEQLVEPEGSQSAP